MNNTENKKQEAIKFLIQYDKNYRIKSEYSPETVIPITYEEIQYTLDRKRYLTEIDIINEIIIDNKGYTYNLNVLTDKQIITIVDTIKENNEKYDIWKESQTEIFYKIQDSGYNIVTCGDCGHIIIHEINNEDNIYCGGCKDEMVKSDCPDLYS